MAGPVDASIAYMEAPPPVPVTATPPPAPVTAAPPESPQRTEAALAYGLGGVVNTTT